MEFVITEYTPGQRPNVILPSTEIFQLLGEEGIRNLVSEHYDCLAESEISDLFPEKREGFERAKKKYFRFLRSNLRRAHVF